MHRRRALSLLPLVVGGAAGLPVRVMTDTSSTSAKPSENTELLAEQYMKRTVEMLTWIRNTQTQNLHEASYAIARTVKNGGTCWFNWDMGHSCYDLYPGRNGTTDFLIRGYNAKDAKKGDLLLANLFGGPYEDLVKKEIFVIGGPAPWGGDAKGQELLLDEVQKLKLRPYSQLWIETDITTLDALVYIPGMPVPFGPFSGIIGIVTYFMMIADACRVLARDGVKVKVIGDEPKLEGDSVRWASLHEPLMDDYFDEVMRQFEMIELEKGYIREAAHLVVDTALSGGKVYCYSRYSGALCAEADSRRAGLALTKGTHGGDNDFKGTAKDCVIMGISKPDDEVDLARLDMFRKCGMKVVSIGPMTRNISKYPSYFPLFNETYKGRTVPNEADIHIGRMCDTYGLFAIPGLEQKVCPTSGALALQIFWVACMEIAGEIIRRTGNAPGVYMSSATKKGKDHNHFMREQYAKRGY